MYTVPLEGLTVQDEPLQPLGVLPRERQPAKV